MTWSGISYFHLKKSCVFSSYTALLLALCGLEVLKLGEVGAEFGRASIHGRLSLLTKTKLPQLTKNGNVNLDAARDLLFLRYYSRAYRQASFPQRL